MSNLISIEQLENIGEISNNSKIFTIKDQNNCFILGVKELLTLLAPRNFTSNNGNSIILRSKTNSITFTFRKENETTNIQNIICYRNSKKLTNLYNSTTGYTFEFDEDDDIKELQIMSTTELSLMTDLHIINGTLYGLDISACKNLKHIKFNEDTLSSTLLDVSWNQEKDEASIITDINPDIQQTNIKWNCQYIIDKNESDINILNRKKIN